MDKDNGISIKKIYDAIRILDPIPSYEKVSYNLTAGNALDQAAPWWVFIPYGKWPASGPPNPSPFEDAILRAIPTGPSEKCKIYIIHLYGGSKEFFCDTNASRQIVPALARCINGLDANLTPVIRYLEGSRGKPNPSKSEIVAAFFGNGPITHKRARFYYGNFAPGLQFASDDRLAATEALVAGFWDWLIKELEKYSKELYDEIVKIERKIISWISQFIKSVVIGPPSWNHAKIFAINGKTLVTGGANYWDSYQTGQTWLFDLAMSITGDAAIDAHRFANYFWKYLGAIPPWDKVSLSQFKLLTNTNGQFEDGSAPLFKDFPPNTGTISALSVGKNGNWPFQDPGFPAQIFDAVRDFTLNLVEVIVEARNSQRTEWTAFAAKTLGDDNPDFRSILSKAGISPAAWASRYARNFAVSQAQKSVRFSQQKLVMDDLLLVDPYCQLVKKINKHIGSKWDGNIWPYDLLMALGYALSNMSWDKSAPVGIQIVTSYPMQGQNHNGYQDPVSAKEFKDKLAGIMRGMQALKYINLNPKYSIEDIVNKFLLYRFLDDSSQPKHGNHSKLVIVDDSVCYIGSDNAYPSYNQEFGICIDDQASIQSFVNEYWNKLCKSQTFGGGGGGEFTDDVVLKRLVGFVISSGTYVDGLQGIYKSGDGQPYYGDWHGGQGGNKVEVRFNWDEQIIAVEIRSKLYVDALTFYTVDSSGNKKQYGPYGGSGGEYAKLDIRVQGFFGRSANLLDQIGFFSPCWPGATAAGSFYTTLK